MAQFYVVEIIQYPSGEFEHNVFWEYDDDADKARLKGESKYHTVLAAAAVSETLSHSAILFSTEATPIMSQCYKHTLTTSEPEPEPEETE